jgi:hypothetical protein
VSYVTFSKRSSQPSAKKQTGAAHRAPSLRIGEPDDTFEREADRLADEIVAAGPVKRHWSLANVGIATPLQTKCSCGGGAAVSDECEECSQKKQEDMVQRKTAGTAEPGLVPPIVHEVLNSPGQPLDTATRAFFEPRFGHAFSGVRIHANQPAAASARAVNALAYTVGRDIVFDDRPYGPNTLEGRRLMAHELTHVVQQAGAAGSLQGSVLQRQAGQTQVPAGNPCPSSTGLETYRQFNHGNLPPGEQARLRTYLGVLVRHDLGPGPDHTGHCIQEELSLFSTDCPASVTTALASCSKSDCLPVNRPGRDAATGTSLPSNRKAFLDIHRTTSGRSVLEGTGKNSCRVICEQKYHCDSLGAPVLGVFRITRNFRADTFTPSGGSPRHITTGEVEKVESFGKGDFPARTLPKGEEFA